MDNLSIDKKLFAGEIFIIFEDRGLKEPSKAWLKKLYDKIKDLDEASFAKGLNKINSINQEEWVKKYGFGGKPCLSDWVSFFIEESTLNPERTASIEVARILDYAKYFCGNDVIFDNSTSNYAVNAYGGICQIAFDIDQFNNKRRPREFVAKDLKEKWLDAFFEKKNDSVCKGKKETRFFRNGRSVIEKNIVDYIGNKEKCIMLHDNINSKGLKLAIEQKI